MANSTFIQQIADRKKTALHTIPDKELARQFIDELFSLLFLPVTLRRQNVYELQKAFDSLKSHLSTLIYETTGDDKSAQPAADLFFETVPEMYEMLITDAEAIYQYDPASQSTDEVIVAYPGFFATTVYRISNQLWRQGVKILPRILTEYAHSKTGIDIHPGASIGEGFFIDHGTGVVIGETTIIGNHVKIYQGVTIGAFSQKREEAIGRKRHPTIEDNVIIYSNATILGGSTIIGANSIIGGNVWLTESVPQNAFVAHNSEIVIQ